MKLKNILLSSVFICAALLPGASSAITVSEFESLEPQLQNQVVSMTLQDLINATATHSGRDAAMCMVETFTKSDASTNSIPLGLAAVVAQMQVQKKLGKQNEAHVEDIIQKVYEIFLQSECADKAIQLARPD